MNDYDKNTFPYIRLRFVQQQEIRLACLTSLYDANGQPSFERLTNYILRLIAHANHQDITSLTYQFRGKQISVTDGDDIGIFITLSGQGKLFLDITANISATSRASLADYHPNEDQNANAFSYYEVFTVRFCRETKLFVTKSTVFDAGGCLSFVTLLGSIIRKFPDTKDQEIRVTYEFDNDQITVSTGMEIGIFLSLSNNRTVQLCFDVSIASSRPSAILSTSNNSNPSCSPYENISDCADRPVFDGLNVTDDNQTQTLHNLQRVVDQTYISYRNRIPYTVMIGLDVIDQYIREDNRVNYQDIYHGIVLDKCVVTDSRFETAVEVAGNYDLFDCIVDTNSNATKLMNILYHNAPKHAIKCVALESSHNDGTASGQLAYHTGVIPILNLITFDPRYQNIMKKIFRSKLVVLNASEAIRWANFYNVDVVTTDGVYFKPNSVGTMDLAKVMKGSV
jgi:hypothetical protein